MSDSYTRIFLLSHMRAYTSLAGHILGSHPLINGYYEMHLDYSQSGSLERQLIDYSQHDELKPQSRYLFDKLLHNDYGLSEPLLDGDARVLLCLRRPEDSIRSIVHLFAQKPAPGRYAQPLEAVNYYNERLQELARFSHEDARSYFYFDAETLVDDPERLLPAIGDWLALDEPLSERYRQFSQTAMERKGDSSARIRSGAIDASSRDYSDIVIPPILLDEAERVYRDCREKIARNAGISVVADRY